MFDVFDFSNLGHGLAVVGIFMLNFLIYEGVCFGAFLMIYSKIAKHVSSQETLDRVINVGMMFACLAFVLLVVLYAGGVFRLIPLP